MFLLIFKLSFFVTVEENEGEGAEEKGTPPPDIGYRATAVHSSLCVLMCICPI